VLDLLTGVVLTRAKLRDALGVKNERLGEALEWLERAGRPATPHAGRVAALWLTTPRSFPFPPMDKEGTERSASTDPITQLRKHWAEDTALLRSNRSADPGAETEERAVAAHSAARASSSPLRDRHQSVKPSRQDAATAPARCAFRSHDPPIPVLQTSHRLS